MKVLPCIVIFCLICTVLQAAAKLLLLAYGAILLAGLIFRTKETVGFIASCMAIRAFQLHPVGCVWAMGVAALAGTMLWIQSRRSWAGVNVPNPEPAEKLRN